MSSYTSSSESVDPLVRVDRGVAVGQRSEEGRFLAPEREDAEGFEALREEAVDAVLERLVEVDEDVAADDDVELVERAVHRDVVLRPDDVLGELAAESGTVVRGDVVLGE